MDASGVTSLLLHRGYKYSNTSKGVPKDPFPKSSEFNSEHFATLVALSAPFHKYPKPFLCLVGISRYYTLDEDAYPEFLGDNDEGMDLLAFIQIANPTKVRVAERQRAEDEPRLLESTIGRVVPLLPIAPARASSELKASVDKLSDEGASGDRGYADVRSVAVTTNTIVEDVAPLQSRRQRKRKTAVADAGDPSHPPKKSSSPTIATVTTVTTAIDAYAMATRAPVAPSLFGVGSYLTGTTDSIPGGFFDVSGSDFLIGGIRAVVDPDSDLQKVYNYHQILPIIAEKLQQEKLKAVKARLNFEEALQYSESKTPNRRRNLKERLGPRGARTRSISPEQRRGRSKSPREKGPERRTMFKRLEKVVTRKQKAVTKVLVLRKHKLLPRNIVTKESILEDRKQDQKAKEVQEGTGSQNQRSKSQAWRMTYPNHGVWFDDLPKESINNYDDLRKAFLENYLQQKKCIKDPVEIHNIKQRNGESMEEFVRRYKLECRDVKGAPECMKISGFMHEITNPELIKRLHDKIPTSMVEMMSVTATFLRGRWRPPTGNRRNKGKFKPPPSMTTPVEKRNANKFCEFHREAKIAKKGETSGKNKLLAILMVQPWQKIARQRITQTFSPESAISFPTLGEEDWTEGPMIIEAEMGGHCVHRIYVDGGSSSEILGEKIWPIGKIWFLVRIGDEEHSTSARMNFMVVRSPSPYNGSIGRPGVRKIRAIPSTTHGMIKFPVAGGIVTLQSNMIIPLECLMVSEPKELCGLLRRHLDVFAWKPANMTRVPRHIAEHRLNVREGCLPIRQKKKGQAPERNKAISEEVKNWLSNPVMVKKHDDSWRMCVDFKDLNKACPKDGYLLSEIDWKIGRNLEVYVDDLVIESRTEEEVIRDAEEMFKTLRKIKMKLNPKKYAFGMREGTFLGYKVDADGLRVSPDKVKAVIDLPSLKCLKDVHKLNGKLAKEAFKEMKQSIAKLPMLTAPKENEELIIYLAAAKEAVCAVLMTERDGKQVPIYFVSRALQGPEISSWSVRRTAHQIHPMEDREELPGPWILFTDESSYVDGSGAGLIIMNPEGMEFTYALRFRFKATNNEVEYEALITGLRIASQMGIQNLQANGDSKLVAN
nr:hypothetical protein [Tanacetum cinerariifolium]